MTDGAEAPNESNESKASRSGIVIVVAAVVIALVVLGKGYGPFRSEVSSGSRATTTTSTIATTVTTLPSKPPADVKVKVVNATSTQGLAGKVRDTLNGRGYTQVTLGDASTRQLQTDVYYLPGSDAEAQAVARALGVNATNVRPMPEPPPVSPGDATVMVLAGIDLA